MHMPFTVYLILDNVLIRRVNRNILHFQINTGLIMSHEVSSSEEEDDDISSSVKYT